MKGTFVGTKVGIIATIIFLNILNLNIIYAGIVARWQFNDGSGSTATDASGNSHNLSFNGSPSWGSGVLCFDGSDDWGSTSDHDDFTFSTELSIHAWVKPDVTTGILTVIRHHQQSGESEGWMLRVMSGRIYGEVKINDNNYSASGTQTLSTTEYSHLAIVWSDNLLKLYVNGNLDGSRATSGSGINSLTDVTIGRLSKDFNGEYFDGCIDSISVFNHAKIPTDVWDPNAPTNLTATAGNGMLALKWRKNIESDVVKYIIYGSTSINPTTKVDSTTSVSDTTKTIMGLSNGTTYYYRITAVDNAGNEGQYSNEVSATPGLVSPYLSDANTVALWHFNEGSGTSALDTSGNGNIGSLSGSATFNTTTKKFGASSIYFNGGTLQFADDSFMNMSSGTIEGWIRSVSQASDIIWDKSDISGTSGGGFRVYYNNTSEVFVVDINGTGNSFPYIMSLNEWIHIAVTWDGTNVKLYINGELHSTVSNSNSPSGSKNISFGAAQDAGDPFYGYMDEVRISNVTRTSFNSSGGFPPFRPQNLTATHGNNQITLKWSKNTESDVAKYIIYGGSSASPTTKIDSTSSVSDTSKIITGLINGMIYYYRITAIDNAGNESVYSNEVNSTPSVFTDISAGLVGISAGSVTWGDYDNDGDLDIMTVGSGISKVFRNDDSTFIDIDASLVGIVWGSAVWGDYDNDGDLDILLAGEANSSVHITKVYRNDGSTFTDIVAGFRGLSTSSTAWGDYDNDGDLDILLTGYDGSGKYSEIYRNDEGNFSNISAGLAEVRSGSAAWGDFDNDGDLDVLLTGWYGFNSSITRVYRNDGGSFTDTGSQLLGALYSSVDWGDYDNDGDLDILLTGNGSGQISQISKVYQNDDGNFTDVGVSLIGVQQGSAVWGDYDNDGDLDVLLSGGGITKVYRNDGNNIFTDIQTGLVGTINSSVSWGDYDNDGDLDILLAGDLITKVYRNNTILSNTAPLAPTGLTRTLSGSSVTLSWNKSTDSQTIQNSLTYNLRLGTINNGIQIISPMADVSTGGRKIAALGNVNHNTSWTIKNLSNGTYYWSVQAIDNGFMGSSFAIEESFTIAVDVIAPTITNVSSTTADGTYKVGDAINITVNFSEAVTLSGGNLDITLETGTIDQTVTISSISSATSASGTYTVQSGDVSNDLSVNTIALSSDATLKDTADNAMTDFSIPSGQNLNDSKEIIIDGVVPTTPSNFTATPSNEQVMLNWSKNTESDVMKYRIYWGTSSNPTTSKDSTTSKTDTTKTITGLTNGITYYFRIKAVDSTGNESSYSTEVNATPHTPLIIVNIDGTGDYTAIQNAINISTDGDTILVYPGTYRENINFGGKNIVVASLILTTEDTSYISQTVVDGNQNGTVVTFESGEDSSAVLSGFTITNGLALDGNGGGIRCAGSHPSLLNLVISGNSAANGAGIFCIGSNPTLVNVTISGNTASSNAGGIWCNVSNPRLVNVLINGNTAYTGGGIVCYVASSPRLEKVVISNNTASDYAGGIWLWDRSNPILVNVTISGNTAPDYAGGIYCQNNSNPTLVNTILWNNSPQEIYYDSGNDPSSITINYSDLQGGQSGIVTNNNGTIDWLEGNINADPLFADPQNADFHLTFGSPCIDGGDPDLDSDGITWENDPNDQDPDGTRMDIGAFYYLKDIVPPTISGVTSAAENGTYKVGDVIDITVNFSEAVTLSGGNLEITLETGSTDQAVTLSSISNATSVSGSYTVQSGDVSSDLSVNTIAVSIGATLKDASGNPMTSFSIPSGQNLNDSKAIVVDGVAPLTPTGLTATPGNQQVALSWTANSESDLAKYKVYRSTTSGFTPSSSNNIADVISPTVIYADSAVSEDTTYFYTISAVDVAGNESDYSDYDSASPLDLTPPTITILEPIDASSYGTEDTLLVSWQASDNRQVTWAKIYFSLHLDTIFEFVDSLDAKMGTYNWEIPDSTVSDNCRLMITVSDYGNNTSSDTLSGTFSIYDNTPPQMSVNSPSSGFSIPEYHKMIIEWSTTDNIQMDSVRIYYSNDGGSLFEFVGSVTSDSSRFEISIPPGVTDIAQVKIVAEDMYGNEGIELSPFFTVTDYTPPTATLTGPTVGTNLAIGLISEITWMAEDNVEVTSIDLRYTVSSGTIWSNIATREPNDGSYSWTIPNEPSDQVGIQLIAYDSIGLSDTSETMGLSIVISYPTVISVTPRPGVLTWRDKEIKFTFSHSMNPMFSLENVVFNTKYSDMVEIDFNYYDSLKTMIVSLSSGFASLDTVSITLLSDGVTTIHGYGLDSNSDGTPGDNYTIPYTTTMLADYDTSGTIDVIDLAQFVQALEEDNYYYELGPVTGTAPHFISILDTTYNIEDAMAFAMIWNWYVTSHGVMFQRWIPTGEPVIVEATSDSIFVELTNNILAYEVQMKYPQGKLSVYPSLEEKKMVFTNNDEVAGIYTYLSRKDLENRLVIPVTVIGMGAAEVTLSFRAVSYDGEILSQLTKTLYISGIPETYALYQNYPNPFNPTTTLRYDLPVRSEVTLTIYDILGRQVRILVGGLEEPGFRSLVWDGTNNLGETVSAGVYLYQIRAGVYVETRKMLLLK